MHDNHLANYIIQKAKTDKRVLRWGEKQTHDCSSGNVAVEFKRGKLIYEYKFNYDDSSYVIYIRYSDENARYEHFVRPCRYKFAKRVVNEYWEKLAKIN